VETHVEQERTGSGFRTLECDEGENEEKQEERGWREGGMRERGILE